MVNRYRFALAPAAVTVLLYLGVAGELEAQGEKKISQAPRKVDYAAREKNAPKAIRERLARMRAEIEAKRLRFRVGYTTALDQKIERLAGTRRPKDLAERAAAQSRLGGELRKADLQARAEFERINPTVRLPELMVQCRVARTTFDWRLRDKVTPVRDQGECGSCWAFATLGAFEGSYAIRNNLLRDVAEQDVLSCSGAGTCAVGWWAFASVLSDGDATEAHYPYTATDSDCDASVARPFRAIAWSYVKSDGGIPSVAEMKQALCEHGPLAVAVYASDAFQGYTSGVFDQKITDQGINHGVTLIGWNDNERAWIIKNSWGTGWGDSGFMHIAWDSNNIGDGAAWVDARNRFYQIPPRVYELMPHIKPFLEPDLPPRRVGKAKQ